MIIALNENSSSQIYHLMTQTLIPRPIAWVLSEHAHGHLNLAPFSYFTAVSSAPPLLMFSVGNKADGKGKDTKVNIATNTHFVVHIPSSDHAHAVTESSRALPAEESELARLSLETVPFGDFPLPRLASCKVAFGCRLHHVHAIPGAPQDLIFGEIEQVYISDAVAEKTRHTKPDGSSVERLHVDALKVDPLARLGADHYGNLGQILTVPRPK
ncbi:flavin reductase family protein [Aliidiomarina halalkaliphila]|uniref:Flavin reductase family protein n=1 Tax=Aliidiomarina halalkaliphila TaxID=2593535 RepID=A0A552X488_9GAMM|nr:flavin reductase family protein [Aliidiomarina halalkaliphila]TRW49776.1 flavin reductase family protein [Aliidiomarina halalkaliphila]